MTTQNIIILKIFTPFIKLENKGIQCKTHYPVFDFMDLWKDFVVF